jgi:hypothetical protein
MFYYVPEVGFWEITNEKAVSWREVGIPDKWKLLGLISDKPVLRPLTFVVL